MELAAAVWLDICCDVISLPVAGRGCVYFVSFALYIGYDLFVFLKEKRHVGLGDNVY